MARVRADWRTRSVARANFARDEAAAVALQSIEMAASSAVILKSLGCLSLSALSWAQLHQLHDTSTILQLGISLTCRETGGPEDLFKAGPGPAGVMKALQR